MNLSERLAQAAIERRRQPEADAQRVHVTPIESQPTSALLPERTPDPVDPGRIAVMKMRLPEPTNPETPEATSTGLPLWQRPFVDVLRDAGLATVTSLPIQRRAKEAIDADLENAELAQTIPMPGVWMSQPVIDIERDELHLPRLATSEAESLASGALRSDHDSRHINLDDVAIDAEIVFDGPSADALLERWSDDVTADVHDRQEKVEGLYRRMIDATQQPRVTFGPIDLRDETAPRTEGEAPIVHQPSTAAAPLSRADGDHTCPQCGALASVDIHDPMRGRIHLSCDSCFKMWQERVAATVESDEPYMRD